MVELQISYLVCHEVSQKGILPGKESSNRENTAAVVWVERDKTASRPGVGSQLLQAAWGANSGVGSLFCALSELKIEKGLGIMSRPVAAKDCRCQQHPQGYAPSNEPPEWFPGQVIARNQFYYIQITTLIRALHCHITLHPVLISILPWGGVFDIFINKTNYWYNPELLSFPRSLLPAVVSTHIPYPCHIFTCCSPFFCLILLSFFAGKYWPFMIVL